MGSLLSRTWFRVAMIALGAWLVYQPAMRGGWVWDDLSEITQNPVVRNPDGLRQIWFQPSLLPDFYPLKTTVQWFQWRWWQDNPFGYHLTNLALHALSGLLVWRVLARLGLRFAWWGGLLFTVHPLAVESVAWIAELKNTLSLALLLLSFDAWLDFAGGGRSRAYARALGWFVAAALAKSAIITFPLFLLLHRWWSKKPRCLRDLGGVVPFFAVSLALAFVTIRFNQPLTGDVSPVGGIAARLSLAGGCIAFYLGKGLLPFGLMPVYPRWDLVPPEPVHLLLWLGAGGAAVWFVFRYTLWGRHVVLAGGWFILFLLPAVGLVAAPYHHFTWVMDHHAYTSLIGLVGAGVAVAEWTAKGLTGRAAAVRSGWLAAALAAVALAYLWSARDYARIFAGPEVFWRHNLERNPGCWPAHLNLGATLAQQGQVPAARSHFEQAVRLHPALNEPGTLATMHFNLGAGLAKAGHWSQAAESYRAALQLRPEMVAAHFNLGNALAELNQLTAAAAHFEAALRFNPADFEAHNNLGGVLLRLDRPREALAHFEYALKLRPDFIGARKNLRTAQERLAAAPSSR